MNKRGFIGAILAMASAPAIVRADSLMRIVPRDTLILGDQVALAARDMLSFMRETISFDIMRDQVVIGFDIFDGVTQLSTTAAMFAVDYRAQRDQVRKDAQTALLRAVANRGDFGRPIFLPVGRHQ